MPWIDFNYLPAFFSFLSLRFSFKVFSDFFLTAFFESCPLAIMLSLLKWQGSVTNTSYRYLTFRLWGRPLLFCSGTSSALLIDEQGGIKRVSCWQVFYCICEPFSTPLYWQFQLPISFLFMSAVASVSLAHADTAVSKVITVTTNWAFIDFLLENRAAT